MLELQCELSVAIARQVRLRLSPERLTALAHRHTRNAEAYELYLRGRHHWNQLTPETNRRAVECYQKATQLDPEFALAWAGLADIYSASPINSDVPLRAVQVLPVAENEVPRVRAFRPRARAAVAELP